MALLRSRRRRAAGLALGLAVLAPAAEALAAWGAGGTGAAAAASATVPTGRTPALSVTGRNVTVSWAATTLAGGDPVSGYTVRRSTAGGATATIGASCNTVQSGLSCTETAVAPGTWSYGVRAVAGSWSGAEGTRATITVAPPSLTIAGSSAVVGSPGTVTATVASFVGPAALAFRLDNATTGQLLTATPTTVPTSGTATATITLPAGVSDGTHNLYAIGGGGDVVAASLVVEAARPTPTSLTTADGGGNAGSVEPGDSVTITFSEPLLASSLCATWADDGAAKSLTSGVTVSVANNNAANSSDLLTVQAAGCGAGGFHFGLIDLGARNYVRPGTTATFGASGASSTITWDPATATLRIVFGSAGTNRFGTVNSSTAVYTPDAAITDTSGLAITGTVSRTAKHL